MADDLEKRSSQLGDKLARRAETTRQGEIADASSRSGMAQAMKLSSEFVAAIIVGTGLGWGIDHLAGTSPFGLIVFLILGFAAGVVNVMRATGSLAPARGTRERETFDREG